MLERTDMDMDVDLDMDMEMGRRVTASSREPRC